MKHVKENVAVALLLAALIVVAFWGIELRLLLLTVVIVVIACLALCPRFGSVLIEKRTDKRHS
ncbi:MAG: hypothetical protein ACXW06_07180 [Halobacteriota archaeon]